MIKDDADMPSRQLDAGLSLAQEPARQSAAAAEGEVTLHQLRIFWAVAHSETLTRAAKQLGLAQPSLSQQLSRLEKAVGTKLFHRRSNEMELTEAGTYLLPRVEQVLRNMQDLQEGLQPFRSGRRLTVRLAGISSMLRILLPGAVSDTQRHFPDIDFDIHDSAPNDILELLYGRRINIGLLSANSVAQAAIGFLEVPLIEDPYVLVVPQDLVLDGISDPHIQLSPEQLALLGRSVQFSFGTQHSRRVENWHAAMLPETRIVAQCRSFEVAMGLVRAGTGVCLAPVLSTLDGAGPPARVRLYRLGIPPRRLVALVPSQYRRQEPYASLLDRLQQIAASFELPEILPAPPFLDKPSLAMM